MKKVIFLDESYCPECHQTGKLEEVDKNLYVKAGLFSLKSQVYQCKKCKTYFINDLGQLWENAQKVYSKFLEE